MSILRVVLILGLGVEGGAHQFLNKERLYSATTARFNGNMDEPSKISYKKVFIPAARWIGGSLRGYRSPTQNVTLLDVLQSAIDVSGTDSDFLRSYCYGETNYEFPYGKVDVKQCPYALSEKKQ